MTEENPWGDLNPDFDPGAWEAGLPGGTVADVFCMMALETFGKLARVMEVQDEEAEAGILLDYIHQFDGVEENPFEYLTRVSLVMDGLLFRVLAGDPNPTGPPSGDLTTSMLAFDAHSELPVDAPMQELALEVIGYAANWKWPKVDAAMEKRCQQAIDEGDNRFLVTFSNLLMQIFVGLDGPERVGLRKS